MEIRTYGAVVAGDPGLHRVQDAAAQVVAQAAQVGDVAGQAGDHGHRRVAIEVVDDDELVRRANAGRQRAEHRLDGVAFVVDREDHGKFGPRGLAHGWSIRHPGCRDDPSMVMAGDAAGLRCVPAPVCSRSLTAIPLGPLTRMCRRTTLAGSERSARNPRRSGVGERDEKSVGKPPRCGRLDRRTRSRPAARAGLCSEPAREDRSTEGRVGRSGFRRLDRHPQARPRSREGRTRAGPSRRRQASTQVYQPRPARVRVQGLRQGGAALLHNPNVRTVVADRTDPRCSRTRSRPGSRGSGRTTRPSRAPTAPGFTGAGVRVAILDTGIDLTHPDLVPNLDTALGLQLHDSRARRRTATATGPTSPGSSPPPTTASGVVGVAPSARLVPIKVLDDTGQGEWSNLICAHRLPDRSRRPTATRPTTSTSRT